jgi:hypothetical protein
MSDFDPRAYGPVIAKLLSESRLNPLDAGSPNQAVRSRLEAFSVEQALAPHPVRDRDLAIACHAGLWLYHNFLEESHTLSQSVASPTGSYWHGLMHRREPDADNAKYWFHRVGSHPIFPVLARTAQELGLSLMDNGWNPFDFIDLCEKYRATDSPEELTLRQVQRREWQLLFDYGYREALG